jgi:hypothetical protein
LEIFQTDSVLGLAGRGYLGKGALKGWMRSDSLKVYFPSTHEYVYEAQGRLLRSFECTFDMPEIDLLALFSTLPDEILFDSRVTVEPDYSNHKRPSFVVYVDDCPWRIELTYDKRPPGWRIRSFSFFDGDEKRLTARRREYKKKAKVKPIVLQAPIPNDAVRVFP